ncbi:thiol-disulfide oxidoreductase [Gimesia panareensis]|uniref:Thiol-disulfide oxidoreductase n=1 Tax=Gimesia panareensis TaxID=2527978 RepID=A0A518FV50_9PLAN|nr:redoxin family protein [Gimesia panareensis]QDV20221.1 thiol-disulfide oxidoreductase [Gimesia panareensis]
MSLFTVTGKELLLTSTRQRLLLCAVVLIPLYSSAVQSAEPQNAGGSAPLQLALKPDQVSSDESTQPAKRPPEVEILETIETGSGYGAELHRVTISGTARTFDGTPLKNATIYVGSAARYMPSGFEMLRGQTRTDETGHYELKDIQLLVTRERPNPIPKPAEGRFEIFGTCAGYGFTWHETCYYRPDVRPQGTELGDKNADVTANAFYLNEPLIADLMFDRPALLKGRITDKQGHPLANAKVQLGRIDYQRNPSGGGIRSCRFLGNDNQPVKDPVSFFSIHVLPTEYRETRTDAEGYYEFKQLRRDSSYLASINPGPTFDPWQFTLVTSPPEKVNNKRYEAVGYAGELNREFFAPRNVAVQVVQEQSAQPVANVLVTARPIRDIRQAGIQARSDSQGNAHLQLLPGEYKLIVEPTPEQPFHFQSEQFFVKEQTGPVQHTVKLRPAAIVILKAVDAQTGAPLPGVRFNYETHDSSEPLPVSTQTVYVDYPETNAAGEIQTFMTPGQRQFVVAEPLTLAQAEGSRGDFIKLPAGEVTTVEFKLSQPQFVDAELFKPEAKPDPHSIYPPDLQLKWHRQAELLRNSTMRVTTQLMLGRQPGLDTTGLLKDLRALDPDQLPDIDALLQKHGGEKWRGGRTTLTSSGPFHKEERFFEWRSQRHDPQGKLLPDSVSFRDGWETLQYDTANNQASVYRKSFLYIHTPYDFTDWPSLRIRRPAPQDRKKPEVEIEQAGRRTIYSGLTESEYQGQKHQYFHKRVFDRDTGFIFESYLEEPTTGLERASFYFAPQKQANGLILPRFFISWRRYQGKLNLVQIFQIEKVELFDQLPADAFAISLPPGALLVDSRHVAPGASPRGPSRPYSGTLRGPVTDFAAYLQRHPRYAPKLEQKVHYGRPAPEIKPASWVTREGVSPPPDTKGKVVLIEFWGTHCGPCIARLPEVRTAARYYADQPFVLIGMHDSHISVPELQKLAEKEEIDYQLAIDRPSTRKGFFGETIRNYNVRGIPSAAVIDQQGNLAYVGYFSQALKTVDRLLKDKATSP